MLRPLELIDSVDALDTALARSSTRPAVIFKHSVTCGTSAMAMEEMQQLIGGAPVAADVYLVEIQRARAVSRAIEDHLGVRHESPQVLMVVDGRVVWHASHFRITAAAVLAAIEEFAGSAQPA